MLFEYSDLINEGIIQSDFADLIREVTENSETEITERQAWHSFVDWHNAAAIRQFKKIIGAHCYNAISTDEDDDYIADMAKAEILLTIRNMKLARTEYQDDGFNSSTVEDTTLTKPEQLRNIQRLYNRALGIIRDWYSIDSGEVYRLR